MCGEGIVFATRFSKKVKNAYRKQNTEPPHLVPFYALLTTFEDQRRVEAYYYFISSRKSGPLSNSANLYL